MAGVLGLASAIASLVTLPAQITQQSYGYISDIRNASKSQKMYLQKVTALTDVLLRIEEAVEESTAHSSLNRWTAYTNEVIKECQKHLSGLKLASKIALTRERNSGGSSQLLFGRLKKRS
jgi:hypothetical protein